jgi:NAD(P)-dependent dehydrogenase (short-subunit alcohol dehydrogenase family)
MNRLQGKVAIITGAGSGVGRACMTAFSAEGACVLGAGRTQKSLDETVGLASKSGGTAGAVVADLSEEASAQHVFDAAIKAYGRVDILVNSAGVGYSWNATSPDSMNDLANTSADKWHEVMSINLDSCFYMCRQAVRQFRAQKSAGSIVNVASISGMLGLAGAHTYTAAKAAMINLTRSMCVAYAADGIRSNCIAPGFIATPMVASVLNLFDDPGVAERITPMKRPGTAEEMALGCLYLASDEASYCNGTVLVIDGGTSARQ